MTEPLVTHEQMTALMDAGYPVHSDATITYHRDKPTEYSHIPTLCVASAWLRSKGLHVSVEPHIEYLPDTWVYNIFNLPKGAWLDGCSSFDTHDAAHSAGITKALLTLKEKK